MKPLKILFILALSLRLAGGSHCSAQTFNVVKATSQFWAGGVVGNYGVKYYIELEATSKKIKPDTVWINGNVYPIDFSVKDGQSKCTTDSVTHKIKYVLWLSEAHTHFNRNNEKDTVANTKPIRQFEGAALISYRVKHRQRFFIIKSFTRLPQLNYP